MPETFVRGPRIGGAWLQAGPLRKVFAALKAGGAETRVVGGAVRNALIDRAVGEIDIATTALPNDVMRFARAARLGAYPTGIEHGTITVVADGVSYEVTTLRRDLETDGRHAVVGFTTVWAEDAARRDFTINALYCAEDGTLYDPVGGLADLRKRRVRFIGDAKERIREDYLRILRFFRFTADYGNGHLDPDGLQAATALKDGLQHLSQERIRAEVLKLLAAPKAAEVARVMDAAGIWPLVLGTSTDPQRLARLQAIERALGQPPDTLARLAALAIDDPQNAPALAQKLRLSNAEAGRLQKAAIVNAAFDPSTPEAAARALLYEIGADAFSRAARVAWARSVATETDPAWRARSLLADRWRAPRMPFTGADLLALGFQPGPRIGTVLKAFEDWWIASDFPPDPVLQRDKLEHLARTIHG